MFSFDIKVFAYFSFDIIHTESQFYAVYQLLKCYHSDTSWVVTAPLRTFEVPLSLIINKNIVVFIPSLRDLLKAIHVIHHQLQQRNKTK